MFEGHYAKQETKTKSNDLWKDNWRGSEHVYLSLIFNQF